MAMSIVTVWIIKLNCQQNCSVSTCSVVNCRMYLCKSACGQYSIQLDIYFHKKSGYYSTVCGGDTATQKGSLSPGLVMVIKCVLLLNQLLTRPVIAILPLEILILILTAPGLLILTGRPVDQPAGRPAFLSISAGQNWRKLKMFRN